MSASILLNAYQALSPQRRQVLQVLGVCESVVSLATLLDILKSCGWAKAETKSGLLTQALLKPELTELKRLGLIDSCQAGMTRMQIAAPFQDFAVQRAVLDGNFPRIASSVMAHHAELTRELKHHPSAEAKAFDARRRTRIAFYKGDIPGYRAAAKDLAAAKPPLNRSGLLNPFDGEVLERIPDELRSEVLLPAVDRCLLTAAGSPEAIEAFRSFVHRQTTLTDRTGESCVNLLVACGDLQGLAELAKANTVWGNSASGCLSFLKAQPEAAEAAFALLTDRLRKSAGRRYVVLLPLPGLMQLLLLLRRNDPQTRETLKSFVSAAEDQWPEAWKMALQIISAASAYANSPDAVFRARLKSLLASKPGRDWPLPRLVSAYVARWYLPEESFEWISSLVDVAAEYDESGLKWLAALCEDVAADSAPGPDSVRTDAVRGLRHQEFGTSSLLSWIQPTSLWKRKLDSLRQVVNGKPAPATARPSVTGYDERMIWELDVTFTRNYWRAEVRPLVQKFSRGTWTKGRPVALERLFNDHKKSAFAFLTEQDHAVCNCIEQSQVSTGYYRYTETVYNLDFEEALPALIGHPLLFAPDDRTQPVELVSRRPQLVIRRNRSGLRVELDPQPRQDNPVVLKKDGPQRIAVVTFTKEQMQLACILDGALDVPPSGEADVLATATSLSTLLSVQSDVAVQGSATDTAVRNVPAEARPHLHLLPCQAGVRAEFFVQPFGDTGPLFVPGEGGENVFTELQGVSASTRRELKREVRLTREIVAACPIMADRTDGILSPFEFPSPDDALELLLQIEPLREDGRLVIHWPQGQSLRLAGSVDATQLRVRIDRDHDWFAASGELTIDASTQLDLHRLVELVSVTPSRFVPLSDGRFLALTEQLRQRVAELAAYAEGKNGTLRFPPIRAAALSDLDEWCSLRADRHWKACLKRIREAGDVVINVPSTLNAELRDYQTDGFRWLCRLAHWGAGACLADDMGLGKTLQAIALLLSRASGGPALVIAPTSVCFNWESELHRFAPTLTPRMFGAGDRDAFLADIGPRDVVITSYGLLHTESERLQAVQWHTAVLDEAQAIKNTLTKRSQAAMSLAANFRLIMTGTPIENHLGELWNLFQFINPGLLGSLEHYQQQFALPIERDHNREVRQQLKRLVQPFLLRRTKTQVLSELPPRIEVTVPVTLTDEEALLYEAARQRAVKQLTSDAAARGQHVRILAEIMRLRRACCHPSLLLPDCGLPGAKLTAFSETIDELLANQHKALVFSQFVDHLAILRDELDRKGVRYQYLDGSTPVRERQRSVAAFQDGEGDVFLISLKAGGTGLNLTAADYVLHMDPWWNPAVEDQAADRAHRLGQRRPVTIYRFITRNTIEDKILQLHATKRDLADSLLEGTDTTGRLSAEELLALIR